MEGGPLDHPDFSKITTHNVRMAAIISAAEALELGLTLTEFYELQAAHRAETALLMEMEAGGGGVNLAAVSGSGIAAFGAIGYAMMRHKTNARRPARSGPNWDPHERPGYDPDIGGIRPFLPGLTDSVAKRRRYSPVSETPLLSVTNTGGFSQTKMPYTRRTAKRPYRKRAPARRKYAKKRTARASSQKIKRVIYSVAEKKYTDVTLSMTNPANTWDAQAIGPLLQQGTTVGTRTGNRIQCRYIEMSYNVTPTNPATFTGAQLRCVLVHVRENQNSATAPGATDIWVDNNQIQSVRNREKMSDFALLADFTTTIPQGNLVPVGIKRYIKVNKQFVYNNNLGTAADLTSGALYLYCLNNAGVNSLTCSGRIRVHFTDN